MLERGPHPGPQVTFQERPAGAQQHQSGVRLPEPVAAQVSVRCQSPNQYGRAREVTGQIWSLT